MKYYVFASFLFLTTIPTFSQTFEVPADYQLKTVQDYDNYEKDVIEGVNWILATPLSEQKEKRAEVNAFLLKWISGSAKVHVEVKPEIVTFMSSSPDLLMLFLGGWTKYSLESSDFDNKVNGSLAGIESVIEFYTKNKEFMSKDKNVEKFIKMKDKGTLKEYVEKNA